MKQKHKRQRHKRQSRKMSKGGSTLLELLVPGSLFAASEFMKNRTNKHVRSKSYLVQQNNSKSKRRRN
jgi:hypothetical protein